VPERGDQSSRAEGEKGTADVRRRQISIEEIQMNAEPFDIKKAGEELQALRSRARQLERQTATELRRRLKDVSRAAYEAQDIEKLLEDVRRLVDAGR
jgi:hypothetical protein